MLLLLVSLVALGLGLGLLVLVLVRLGFALQLVRLGLLRYFWQDYLVLLQAVVIQTH